MEIVSGYKEDYEKAFNLISKESKNDPLNEPYRSLYAAKELFLGIQENLENILASILAEEAEDGKEDFTYKVILAYVQKNLGYIYAKTEDPTLGEKYLKRSIELIEPHKMMPEAIIPYIGALNELGNILENAKKFEEALEWLKLSEKVYYDFKAIENAEAISITDLFGTSKDLKGNGSDELEKLYTQCTFYIVPVYSNLKEGEKAVTYLHKGLRRQLDSNSYERINFALYASYLSQYFLNNNMFKEARHYLAVTSWMMAEHEAKMITPEMSEGTIDDVKETFKRHQADLARSWANYGLALLRASKERLSIKDDEKWLIDIIEKLTRAKVDSNDFRFPNLQLEVYENSVSTEFCLNLDDAKLIFLFVVNGLNQAKAYYKLETKPIQYAGIIKEYADLYEDMAFFQENPVYRAKMQKRRAQYYEELIDALGPSSIRRECCYGAGVAYCAILDVFPTNRNNPLPALIEKINQVCQKGIKHFLEFQNSYNENDSIANDIRALLYSCYFLCILYYKMVPLDYALKLEYTTMCYKYNKIFLELCDKHKVEAKNLKTEIHLSKELNTVLQDELGMCEPGLLFALNQIN